MRVLSLHFAKCVFAYRRYSDNNGNEGTPTISGNPLHGLSDETTAISPSLLEEEVYRVAPLQRDSESAEAGGAPGLTARLEPARQAFADSLYTKDAGRHQYKW